MTSGPNSTPPSNTPRPRTLRSKQRKLWLLPPNPNAKPSTRLNGRYKDPDSLPWQTRLSLKPRIYNPQRPKSLLQKLGLLDNTEPLKPLPGSCLPGQQPNPLIIPPAYTVPPKQTLPGNGDDPNIDPLLQQLPLPENPAPDELPPNPPDINSSEYHRARQIQNANEYFKKQKELKRNTPGPTGVVFPTDIPETTTNRPNLPPPPSSAAGSPADTNPPPQSGPRSQQLPYALPQPRTFIIPEIPNITDVRQLARLYTQEAIGVLVEIMHDPKANANARVTAAEGVLSRGWGKPDMAIQANIKKSINELSDEEIMTLLASAATDVTFDATPTDSQADSSGDAGNPAGSPEESSR